MDDLIAFLRARLDELERIALAAGEAPEARQWAAGPDHVEDGERGSVARYRDDDRPLTGARAVHIARHDPARVLADIESKRRIIDMCRQPGAQFPDFEGGYESAWDDALTLLALPHSDHPEYREGWAP